MKLEYVQGQLDALRWMNNILADAQQQLQNELIKELATTESAEDVNKTDVSIAD